MKLIESGNFKGCDFEIKNIYYKNTIEDGVEISIDIEDYLNLQDYIFYVNHFSSLNPKSLI